MTVELDIVERKNEENLKLSKQMLDTMKKLNIDENEPIAPITPTIDADLDTTTTTNNTAATELQRFYAGKNVFITGGTGFLGKTLIDKLLRSCPGVENIYLLVRKKKGLDIHTRLEKIFDDNAFERLRETVPKFRHKIVALEGDCALAGFGLKITDRQTLLSNVNIVFHCAATVRFDEKLRLALNINVHGTRELLELCTHMEHLQVVMHVSTAYSNCHLRFIEEKFYNYPFHFDDLSRMIEKMDDKALDKITPTLLGKWPNTYAFTKAMSEDLIRMNGKNLPLGMFRPAIVTSSVREPVVGYIDNLYGPTGVVAGAGTGLLRTMHCNPDMSANIVPVDMTVNALIASAWDVATNNKDACIAEDIPIYNYVSSVENPLTWGQFTDQNIRNGFDYPFSTCYWYVSFHMHKTAFMNRIYMVFLHLLPALIFDLYQKVTGGQENLLKFYKKIHKFSSVISFFCTNEWMFTNSNVQRLWRKIGRRDQELFDFNIRNVDWEEYSYHYIKGMRLYYFKDDLSTVDAARKKWRKYFLYHQIIKTLFYGISAFVALYTVWAVFSHFFY
ncbi:fatty acyl-CoA reductase wat-like [Contarinia nasturtii]|uniref:fatty acyl-CoA reductase wat-like n=1 Tax=Contarinia nasturtii TaxID=265458 RepID=UPI0012D3A6D6|nr:fatty acyl-CoA reductase wat-like [Contarinia nasturtii]XP_031622376.1 fatty acyl-CoA reductase wat-like [Contarinia nasturtii]XP_031622377.1 fatty acyl-CoA reductase wat-like [Contarinia nasturtii]